MNDISFCNRTANIWQLVGYVFLVIKIVIPLIIIILGMVELSKAVLSSDEKAIRVSATNLFKKIIIGVIIFFIPTVINFAFYLVSDFLNVSSEYDNCFNCLTSPNSKCNTSYKSEIFGN